MKFIAEIWEDESIVESITCKNYASAYAQGTEALDSGFYKNATLTIREEGKEYSFALCAGRHDMPCEKAIFPQEIADPTNIWELYKQARNAIPADAEIVRVYVTGLTVALGAVIQACVDRGLELIAMHYDRQSKVYFDQRLLPYNKKEV